MNFSRIKILASLAGLSLIITLSGCAEGVRTHIARPPLAESPSPQTIFGEATLTPKGNPSSPLDIPKTPKRPLSLDECLVLAQRVSPELDSAEQSYVGAMWTRWQSVTAFLPKGTTEYSALHNDNSLSTAYANSSNRNMYQWNVTVTQPIFTGFRNTANYILSELGISAADIQKAQVKEDLRLSVKQAYFSILATEKALKVARQTVVNLQSHLNVAQNFFEVGMVPKNEVLEAEVNLATATLNETNLARDLVVNKTRLNILLRQPTENPIEVVDILKYTPFPLSMVKCIDISINDSPEMKLARNQVDSRAKGIDIARAGYFPTLTAVYRNDMRGDSPGLNGPSWAISGNDPSSWSTAAVLSFDFWEWGNTKAEVEKSKIELNRSINDLTRLEDATKLEVTTNYQNLLSAGKNIDVSAKAVVAAAEDLRMVNERYLEQVATNTEVLDAQTRYSQAQYEHYQALYNYNLAWAALERSLGRPVTAGSGNNAPKGNVPKK